MGMAFTFAVEAKPKEKLTYLYATPYSFDIKKEDLRIVAVYSNRYLCRQTLNVLKTEGDPLGHYFCSKEIN